MAKVYIGEHPCPGCGKNGLEARRNYKEGVCWKCLNDLRKYRDIEQRTEGRSDSLVRFRVLRHEIPYITSNSDYENLIKAVKELLIKLDIPDGESCTTEKLYYGSYFIPAFSICRTEIIRGAEGILRMSDTENFIIREDIAIQIDSLMNAIENFSKTAYKKGKQDGANLLQKLAVEKIRPADFYEEVGNK